MVKTCPKCNSTEFYVYGSRRSCKPCTRIKSLNRYNNLSNEDQQKYRNRSKQWQIDNCFRYYWLQARNRAKKKNLEFTITPKMIEDLFVKQNGRCFYSGISMLIHDKNEHSISIDRRDSTKGYTSENIVLCCLQANLMKNNRSEIDFFDMIKAIYNHQQTRL